MSHLSITALSKFYGDLNVLKSIDLDVDEGTFVALLGPSGCGKSTLLRIIAGLEKADGGEINLVGRDVTALAPEKRNVALMFQSYALLPHMSVSENVRFPLRMQNRHSFAEQASRVSEALELVRLVGLDQRYPRQLSGGQQQRVALARSIVAEPDVLLLDEPLSNLDARLREDMQIELKRLHEKLGLTTVFVTHDQTEALALADTVVLMNDGRIEQQDTPQNIYRRPATQFAADFIGGANIFDLEVSQTKSGWSGKLPDGTAVPLAASAQLKTGRQKFMLRKELVLLNPSEDTSPGITGLIVAQSFMGGINRYLIQAGGLEFIALGDANVGRQKNEKITIGWHSDNLLPLAASNSTK